MMVAVVVIVMSVMSVIIATKEKRPIRAPS